MTVLIALGIGNKLGGDDGAGNYVVEIINGRLAAEEDKGRNPEIVALDGGTVPENFTSVIRRRKPDRLALIDAADMGLPPGAVRLVPPERLRTSSFTTHSMPLMTIISYVKEFCGQVSMVGIQPGSAEYGRGLSEAVRRSAEYVADTLLTGHMEDFEILD